MQKIILVSLLILCYSKLSTIDYDKDITIDDNNKEFELVSQEDSILFMVFTSNSGGDLKFDIFEGNTEMSHGNVKSSYYKFMRFLKGKTYKIQFELPNKNAKGTLWVNPSYNEIEVDLGKVYQWQKEYDLSDLFEASLIYKIDKAEKKVTFKFEYVDKKRDSDLILQNPFEVCHGQDCKVNITTYNFEKGESYKIYARVKKINIEGKDRYIMPAFTFHDINKIDAFSTSLRYNLWIIALLLLLIL